MNRAVFAVSLLAAAYLLNGAARAFVVGSAPSLDELIREANFIGKVTVLESKPVVDSWFDGVRGFAPVQTRLEVLATYKGDPGRAEIGFRHFPAGEDALYVPQTYRLERGRTYILFAAQRLWGLVRASTGVRPRESACARRAVIVERGQRRRARGGEDDRFEQPLYVR